MTAQEAARAERLRRDHARERRSQLRGLLYLAAALLLFFLIRHHWGR